LDFLELFYLFAKTCTGIWFFNPYNFNSHDKKLHCLIHLVTQFEEEKVWSVDRMSHITKPYRVIL